MHNMCIELLLYGRPMVSTLIGILLSNTGIIPCNSPAVYGLINKYMLPLAIPMLLFTADLRLVQALANV